MAKNALRGIGMLSLISALANIGCYQGDMDTSSEDAMSVVHEVQVSATKRVLFIDQGDGNISVAEISAMGDAPVVTNMIRQNGATPLEILLATDLHIEEIPAILVENHNEVAAMQGREDLEPRVIGALPGAFEAQSWGQSSGTTTCDENGWEGPNGVWGNPVDSWDNIFANSTSIYESNTTYPRTKSITQSAAWNGGSGSYHTHGGCLAADKGSDNKITIAVEIVGQAAVSANILELPGNNYVLFTDYIGVNKQTKSTITNMGNSSASFRHSAAAWVPLPG